MARKRAPGGGRKRSPLTPTAQLTVRMPDELRAELEAAARKRGGGRTLTDEVVARLRASFVREYEQSRNPGMQAIGYLISDLSERAHMGDFSDDWHRDLWIFRAFKIGVARLLDALEPGGELQLPFFASDDATPESHGAQIAASTFNDLIRLAHAERRKSVLDSLAERPDLRAKWGDQAAESMAQTWDKVFEMRQAQARRMSHARRDLGMKEPKVPKS